MTHDDHVQYWTKSALHDRRTMNHLFSTGDYDWSLFLGHLVVEKLLKAVYVRNKPETIIPPRSHDVHLTMQNHNWI